MWIFTAFVFVQSFCPQLLGFTDFVPIIYSSNRLIWSLAISWISVACNYGYGGVLNDFLSAKLWMPIEKIGLSLYMVHPSVMIAIMQKRRSPVDFNTDTIVS